LIVRIITLEEHFIDTALSAASGPVLRELGPDFAAAYAPDSGLGASPSSEALLDLSESRLADMDKNGISMQVLSCLWAQQAPADVAPDLVRNANNTAAEAIRAHPDRFAAFAALPTAAPEAAARELERCVSELGFVGTLINGRTGNEFLDAPRFDPSLPPVAVTEWNYSGLEPLVTARLQASAWGWHVETGVHFLHMVLAGVFDRYPGLQIILGHWGELIPFYLERLHEMLPQLVTKLDRALADYVRQNVYITPGGMFSQAHLQFCVETLGTDRILCAVDYPFLSNEGTVAFLEQAKLGTEDKHKIAHGNAEKLLGV
jgi:hypothetical protein